MAERRFEWDEEKDGANVRNHGVDFKTAALAFRDPLRRTVRDERFSYGEDRLVTFGYVRDVLYIVVHVEREATRIISARRATPSERRYHANR